METRCRRAILATYVVVASCTPFSGEPEGKDDGGRPESGVDAAAGAGDAAANARFCLEAASSSEVVFCADFETAPKQPPFGFDDVNGTDGAFALLRPLDRPESIVLSAKMSSGSKTRSLDLGRDLGPAPPSGRVEMELDVQVVSTDLQYAALAVVAATAPEYADFQGLGMYAGGDALGGIAPPDRPKDITAGSWHHVRLGIDTSKTGRVVTVEVDGTEVEKRQRPAFDARANLDVRIGVFFTSENASGAEVLFDNVVVRRRSP